MTCEFSQDSLSFKSDVDPPDLDRAVDMRVALPRMVHADGPHTHWYSSLVMNRCVSQEKRSARVAFAVEPEASRARAACATRRPATGSNRCACVSPPSSTALKSCIFSLEHRWRQLGATLHQGAQPASRRHGSRQTGGARRQRQAELSGGRPVFFRLRRGEFFGSGVRFS